MFFVGGRHCSGFSNDNPGSQTSCSLYKTIYDLQIHSTYQKAKETETEDQKCKTASAVKFELWSTGEQHHC